MGKAHTRLLSPSGCTLLYFLQEPAVARFIERCADRLEAQSAQSRMFVGASAQGPMELAIGRFDRQFIDARMPCIHQTLFVELPILVSVGAEPVSRVVVEFVCEPYCDAIALECPQLFDEPVVELSRPLSCKECNDLLSTSCEFGAVPPT